MTNPISGFDDAFAAPPSRKSPDELGQEDFLTLMITQFQNQDPFEPMDNGQFLGQLAQFSTVSGIDSLNSGFAGLEGALRDEQALQAAGILVRRVAGYGFPEGLRITVGDESGCRRVAHAIGQFKDGAR